MLKVPVMNKFSKFKSSPEPDTHFSIVNYLFMEVTGAFVLTPEGSVQ